MDTVILTLDEVRDLAFDVLKSQEFSTPQAEAIAETVTAAERDRCESHGLHRIPFYVRTLTNRHVDPTAEPELVRHSACVLGIDAKFGFAPYALKLGIPDLIEAGRAYGIAALCVRNAYHIASLWHEVEALARADLVGFAFTNALPAVAPAGGTKRLFGTNPMAFAWPRRKTLPFVFDQASSFASRGDVQLYKRDEKSIPVGWAIDAEGKPTTDPTAALEGALLPFADHKGSSLALMIELLSGALIGDLFSHEVEERDPATVAPCGGELIIAIEPGILAGDGDRGRQDRQAEGLFAKILEQEGTRIPSSRRYAAREETIRNGVTIPSELLDTLRLLMRN